MSEETVAKGIARRAATRLATDVDPGLPDKVKRMLADDPLAHAPKRTLEPVSLGSLIVSLASLAWTIYRDLKKDRDAGKMDRAAEVNRLATRLRDSGGEGARIPVGISGE